MSRIASRAMVDDMVGVMAAGPRTSPAITTRLVVASVSQATRASGIAREVGVDDRVGDAVADLVRMALGNRFAGEK